MDNQAAQIVDAYTKLGKQITAMATELNKAKEIINECSGWLEHLRHELISVDEQDKLDVLIGNINDILGR